MNLSVLGLRGWELLGAALLVTFLMVGMYRQMPSIRNLGGTPIPGQGTPNIGGRGLI
jgi:hypothetical protein